MESKYFSRASIKRGHGDEIQDSPSAKRVKRNRPPKALRVKKQDDKDYFESEDWVPLSTETSLSSTFTSKTASKSEKAKAGSKSGVVDETENGQTSIAMSDSTAQTATGFKIEPNTRKPRIDTGPGSKHSRDYTLTPTRIRGKRGVHICNTPTEAGPSKPRPPPVKKEEEYIPLSELPVSPPKDLSFKAYPPPPPIKYNWVPPNYDPKIHTDEWITNMLAEQEKILAKLNSLAKDEAIASQAAVTPKPKEDKAVEKAEKSSEKKKGKKKKDKKSKKQEEDVEMTDVIPKIQAAEAKVKTVEENNAKEPSTPPSLLTDEKILAAPAGTRTLKAINKHLKAIEAKLDVSPLTGDENAPAPSNTTTAAPTTNSPSSSMDDLRAEVARLSHGLELTEIRMAVRHEVLFNALLKVSRDVSALTDIVKQQQEAHNQHTDRLCSPAPHHHGNGTSGDSHSIMESGETPAARAKRLQNLQNSRKTYEQCLRIYVADMDRAQTKEDVGKLGKLVMQYSEHLFKTLG